MPPNKERRPRPEAEGAETMHSDDSASVTLGGALFNVEIALTESARTLEWAAVTVPDLQREAVIVFRQAARLRSRRMAA